MAQNFEIAPDKVKCSNGGKHVPSTLEGRDSNGTHIKRHVCKKCNKLIS